MRKHLESSLLMDDWKYNVHGDALDKGNTRVYGFDDIYVIRFDYSDSKPMVLWRNKIDGSMDIEAIKKIIDFMASI